MRILASIPLKLLLSHMCLHLSEISDLAVMFLLRDVLAMYHDVTEIITGDLPTPIKYYSHEIKGAYDEIEQKAKNTLVSYLPDDLKEDFEPLFCKTPQEEEAWTLVKAADKLSALIKCLEERQMGNTDFASAEKSTLESIVAMNIPEANVFLDEFIPAYTLTLDEQA